MIDKVNEYFPKSVFKDTDKVVENFKRIVTTSSLVSVFEKVKFKDAVESFTIEKRKRLSFALKELLYGVEGDGFEMLITVLSTYKLAKWPILTVLLVYMNPSFDVLVKPTTVKNIIKYFEIEDIKYSSKASYEFYEKYRDIINEMKTHVHSSLGKYNAGFSGFLMIGMD